MTEMKFMQVFSSRGAELDFVRSCISSAPIVDRRELELIEYLHICI